MHLCRNLAILQVFLSKIQTHGPFTDYMPHTSRAQYFAPHLKQERREQEFGSYPIEAKITIPGAPNSPL